MKIILIIRTVLRATNQVTRNVVVISALVALIATSCSVEPDNGLSAVATTTMLGDVVRNIVGADASVEVLLPLGVDPHDYQPSSKEIAGLSRADLVIANGLGLEAGFVELFDGANVLAVGEHVDPRTLDDETFDPHVWLDPVRLEQIVTLVAEQLNELDPNGEWEQQAERYRAELMTAHVEIQEMFSSIPAERRLLVTSHDSLGYLADRYGFQVVGTLRPGGSSLSEPSSAQLAELISVMRRLDVPAIFVEAGENTSIADVVASELGSGVMVVELHIGSLGGPGSGAETLIELLLTNAERIVAALS